MIGPAPMARRRPQRDTTRTLNVPPPDGLNLADPAGALPPTDCLKLDNLIRGEYGLRPRLGTIEHCTGLGAEVRTVLPYQGSTASADKEFACTSAGIYDVTTSSASPSQVFAFPVVDGSSGWGSGFVYQTSADRFIVYTDESNGYILYTESTNTWAKVAQGSSAGQINGVDPGTFAYAVPWKNRIWFVQRNTSKAWYLGLGAVTGTVASWEFGNRLKAGGTLVGLWNWTIDGGFGIDDFLVAVTTGGDVAVYQGTDPSSASTFAIKGVYSCGAVPEGRRIGTTQGGDLLLLTSLGVLPLSRLVSAAEKLDPTAYSTRKIAPLVARYMDQRRTRLGWAMVLHPEDNALLLILPQQAGETDEQLAMAMATKGWSRYRGLDIVCAEAWRGTLYFGTSDGRVLKNTGHADGILRDGTGATAISWSLLTGFSDLGLCNDKRLRMARPFFATDGTEPAYNVTARYDFDVSALPTTIAYTPTASGWDVGTWDNATWDDGAGTSNQWIGTTGMGRHLAVGLNGTSTGLATLTGITAVVDTGGAL